MSKEEPSGPLACLGEMNDCRKRSGLTCSFVLFAALNLAMLVVGMRTRDDCPEEPMIPTYLIGNNAALYSSPANYSFRFI